FRSPTIPVFANATAEAYPAAPAAVRELLASSIAKRVRFVDVVEAMYARGVRTFVEVGPGADLTAMIDRICGDRPHRAVALDRTGRHGVTCLWQSLAQVAIAGHAVDFSALWREFALGPDPRAEPKPKMTVRISGTNYGKKYPPEGGAAGLPRPNPPRAQVAKRANGVNGEVMEHKSSAAPETAMPRAPAAKAAAPWPYENGNGVATNGSARAPHREALAESPTNGTSVVSRTQAGAWRGGEASHWLSAYEAIQCRTAEAHAVYQQTMAQCHLAFLRAAEQSAMALASLAMSSPSTPMPALSASRGMALPPAHDPHDSFAMPMQTIQWSAPAHAPAPVVARAPAPRPPPPPPPVSDAGLVAPPAAQVRAPSPAAAPPAPVVATPPKAAAP